MDALSIRMQSCKGLAEPCRGPRSIRTRDRLALTRFRRMFTARARGMYFADSDMHVVEMNEFATSTWKRSGERSSSMIFSELRGTPRDNFIIFISLAQASVASQVTDVLYLVQEP